MKYEKYIGKIHPAFFTRSKLFSKCDKQRYESGDVEIQSPFFVLSYKFADGLLLCDDDAVLNDFCGLIHSEYGNTSDRKSLCDSYDIGSVVRDWSILSFGVCILPSDDTGWDGSINSIYFDTEAPGKVVSVEHTVWNKKMLMDSWKLSKEDIGVLGSAVSLPNLLDSVTLLKGEKRDKVENLIKQVI